LTRIVRIFENEAANLLFREHDVPPDPLKYFEVRLEGSSTEVFVVPLFKGLKVVKMRPGCFRAFSFCGRSARSPFVIVALFDPKDALHERCKSVLGSR
jgi:hypothetical protein